MMNIFETIQKAGALNERCHSHFLADALEESVSKDGDRSLFDEVWKLIAPPDWDVPTYPEITPEYELDKGRIDIVIQSKNEGESGRVVGIEVKTNEESVESGQLEKYREGLANTFPDADLAMAYLTPFNRERAGERADSLRTIREFDDFAKNFDKARHISWLDVADIPWDGNLLWEQHREYVRCHISPEEILDEKVLERQTLEKFLDSCEDPKAREAASRLFDVATSEGANIQPLGKDGLWIQIWCPLARYQVSVAWIYPPNRSGRYGFRHFRDLSFGARSSTLDSSHPRLQEILEQWTNTWSCNGEFPTENVANNQGLKAYSISYDNVIGHIDLIEGRLKEVISEINSL